MPFNGSGTYIATSLPGSWNPATTGSSATPADWNTLLADLSTALSTTITKDGQTTITADIPFATHKITGLGNGTAAQDAATLLQTGQMVFIETGAVATGSTQIPQDDSIPTNTEGDEYMTLAITPRSATSKLLIQATALVSSSATANNMIIALFQDSTAAALAANMQNVAQIDAPITVTLMHSMTSGTTSSTTFKIRIGGAQGGTTTFNGVGGLGGRMFGGVAASGITIREVFV